VTFIDVLLISLLVGVAAFTQGLTGFGFSLVLVPPLTLIVGAKDAVVLANLLSAFQNLLTLARMRGGVQWTIAARLFGGSVVGMPVGLAVLILMPSAALQIVIAITVFGFTILLGRGWHLPKPRPILDGIVGTFSGVLNTSTSMSGPPVVVFLQGRRLPPDTFRATLTAYFFASSLVAVALLAAGGRLDTELTLGAAIAAPGLIVGLILGLLLYRKVDAILFRKIVIGTLVLSSILATISAISRL
jgi:uncharacterized membrane protein YfcA